MLLSLGYGLLSTFGPAVLNTVTNFATNRLNSALQSWDTPKQKQDYQPKQLIQMRIPYELSLDKKGRQLFLKKIGDLQRQRNVKYKVIVDDIDKDTQFIRVKQQHIRDPSHLKKVQNDIKSVNEKFKKNIKLVIVKP